MAVREKNKELQNLFDNGEKVYSISKLNTFNNCQYEYWNTYIKRNKGLTNIYSELGTILHDGIQNSYINDINISKCQEEFYKKIDECELLGIKFPDTNIKESFIANINYFFDNYKKLNKNIITEKFILFQIQDYWIQMYIDAIVPDDDGRTLNIIDWKTSSKFSGQKKIEAGRQLLIYKLGIESKTNKTVSKVMWNMLKYCNVCYAQKNGKVKKSMQERRKWVSSIANRLKDDLSQIEIDEFESEMMINYAVNNNTIEKLPQEIRKKYWVEDAFIEYEINEDNLKEIENYVISTIHEIESKIDLEDEWKPVEINDETSYYCNVLCNHRKTCKYLKKYNNRSIEEIKKKKLDDKKIEEEFSELFGG
jgi:hypothetical protein